MTEIIAGEGFQLRVDDYPSHSRVRVEGSADSIELSLRYWRQVGQLCRERAIRNLLIVEDLEPFEDPKPEDFERVIACMVESGFLGVRIAFVDAREETEANEFGMLLGAEAGLTMLMFSNESYGEHWLRFGS